MNSGRPVGNVVILVRELWGLELGTKVCLGAEGERYLGFWLEPWGQCLLHPLS